MTPNQLRVFRTVLDMQSVTLAATALFITQPSATQQIRALERALKVKLFRKTGGRLEPTEAALELSPVVDEVLAAIDHLERRAELLRADAAEKVTVGVNTTGGMYVMPPVIRAFVRKYPASRIDLVVESASHICAEVLRGRVDVGFAGGPIDIPQFETRRLGVDVLGLIMSPEHPLAAAPIVPHSAVSESRWILPPVGSRTRLVFESRIREVGLEVRDVLSLQSTAAVKRAVEANLGVGVVSKAATRLEVTAGTLVVRDLEGVDLSRGFEMFFLREGRTSQSVATFMSFVERSFMSLMPLSMRAVVSEAAPAEPGGEERAG